MLELTRQIFEDANIVASFHSLPPNRIIDEIKKKHNQHCSIGWLKILEREQFAKFSLPIYQNKPIVVLINNEEKKYFSTFETLKNLFSDKSKTLLRLSGFSYGAYIDNLIKSTAPSIQSISGKQAQLAMLIKHRKGNYMLIAPEEVEMLVLSAKFKKQDFELLPLKDIPTINKRYLMFNKAVSDQLIEKVNRSIIKLVDNSIF